MCVFFFFSSRRRHTRLTCDWSSDVCSSDLIAKLAMHQREYTLFIRPYDHGLALHTMYFANEVREVAGYGKVDGIKISPQEVKLAEQLVSTLSKPFDLK